MCLLVLSILMLNYTFTAVSLDNDSRPVIVVTFSFLEPDVLMLVCGDMVYSIVPIGVDPHEYQLRPSDIEILREADLVISTGHTNFELKIEEMISRKEISARLINILNITGVTISINPVTSQPNYHNPIQEPLNYILFLGEVTKVLADLNPSRKECYYERYLNALSLLSENVLKFRNKFSENVIVDKPYAQYLVEWLGFKVIWIVKPEEEYQLSAESLLKVREIIDSEAVKVLFYTEPADSPESRIVIEIAEEKGIPVIPIPGPSTGKGVLNVLREVTSRVLSLLNEHTNKLSHATSKATSVSDTIFSTWVAIIISFIIGVLLGVVIREKGFR